MKFLAILKDSLLEAIDTKIFYATIAISLLIVLGVFSLSFRPISVEEEVNRVASSSNDFINEKFSGQGQGRPQFRIDKFEQTNAGGQPWERTYHFQFVVQFPQDIPEGERAVAAQSHMRLVNEIMHANRMLDVDKLTVKPIEDTKANEVACQVDFDSMRATNRLQWPHTPGLLFGLVPMRWLTIPLEGQLWVMTDMFIGWFGAAITLLLSIIVTAFFIPNMLRKGTVDLLLAKPIHRTTLLLYKFVGGMWFMLMNTAVIMGGIFLALGLRTGVWMPGLLLCIGIFTFEFALFYAISTATSVLTRSPIVAILASIVAWGILLGVGYSYRFIDLDRPEKATKRNGPHESLFPSWVYPTADVIHFVLPHYKDLDALTTKVIVSDFYPADAKEMKGINEVMGSINWTETLTVTSLYIVCLVGFSCFWFAIKDY